MDGKDRKRRCERSECVEQALPQQVQRRDHRELAYAPTIAGQPEFDGFDAVVERQPDEHGADRLSILLGDLGRVTISRWYFVIFAWYMEFT